MAEPQIKLDKLEDRVRREIRLIGGDPDFVEFLLGWYNCLSDPLRETRPLPFTTWRYWTTSRQKNKKRELQKQFPKDWKQQWKKIQAQAKSYVPPTFQSGLFSIDLIGPTPAHAPFARNYWLAVCDVKAYFTKVAKRPHWHLIQHILFPGKTATYAQSEWARRKKQFAHFDNAFRLNRLVRFYSRYQPVIAKVLQTRIPIWATPHPEEFQRLVSLRSTDELFSWGNDWRNEGS